MVNNFSKIDNPKSSIYQISLRLWCSTVVLNAGCTLESTEGGDYWNQPGPNPREYDSFGQKVRDGWSGQGVNVF